MPRALSLNDDGELEALDQEGFDQLSDLRFTPDLAGVSLGNAVYIKPTGEVAKTTGRASTSPCIGFISALLVGGDVLVRREGEIDYVGLTIGTVYFVDPTVAGGITATPPTVGGDGEVIQEVGVGLDGKLGIRLDSDYTELG
jgi:hypothetical protein